MICTVTQSGSPAVATAARDALTQGLEVWFSPALWDETPEATMECLTEAARPAESISRKGQDRMKMVFVVGGELCS